MSSIIIAACPVHGHVTPLLTVARGFIERGDDVRFITGAAFADRVTATGATHIALPPDADFNFDDLEATFPERAGLKGTRAITFDVEHVFANPAKPQYEAVMPPHTAQPPDVVLAWPGRGSSAPCSCPHIAARSAQLSSCAVSSRSGSPAPTPHRMAWVCRRHGCLTVSAMPSWRH